MLQILVEIIQELENITDVQLKRSALSLDSIAPGETTIGAVHSEPAKRAYALGRLYTGRAADLAQKAELHADTREEQAEAKRESRRAMAYASVLGELFWCEARNDVAESAWNDGDISIRAGWTLVRRPSAPNPLKSLFGGISLGNDKD